MIDRIEGKNAQETRTVAFFGQDVEKLKEQLINRIFVLYGSDKKFLLTDAEAWAKEKNTEKRYQPVHKLEAGDLFVVPFPLRKMNQSIIVANSSGEVGACVRLKRVNYFDTKKREFSSEVETDEVKQREGDIAKYLGLEGNEVYRLAFLDNSDTLYIIPKDKNIIQLTGEEIDPQDADTELRKLAE